MFVEEAPLLVVAQRADEVLGGAEHPDEERRVRPVEGVGVERVTAATLRIDTGDTVVEVPDLRARRRRPIAVVHDDADRIQRPKQPFPPLGEELRMLLDGCTETGVHVLHRSRPEPLQQSAPVAEVLPRRRFRPQRVENPVACTPCPGAVRRPVRHSGGRPRIRQ